MQVVVHVDRELGILLALSIPSGATVRDVKQQLSSQDLTGETTPEDLRLRLLGDDRILSDAETLDPTNLELEVVHSS